MVGFGATKTLGSIRTCVSFSEFLNCLNLSHFSSEMGLIQFTSKACSEL